MIYYRYLQRKLQLINQSIRINHSTQHRHNPRCHHHSSSSKADREERKKDLVVSTTKDKLHMAAKHSALARGGSGGANVRRRSDFPFVANWEHKAGQHNNNNTIILMSDRNINIIITAYGVRHRNSVLVVAGVSPSAQFIYIPLTRYLVIFNTRYGPKGVDIVDCGLPTPEKLAMAAWIRVVRLYHSTRILYVSYGGLFLQSFTVN